jgi:MoaA/NifB/PqqE/SkfB family radical SAM enzyme
MGPAGELFKALQIHPTRLCNLTCLHCYSSSGPDQREALSAPLLVDAITQAGVEGYNDIAFSGGEPILYGDLRRLLEHAKSLGMLTSLTSNGILLKGERLARLEGVTDLLAISLDGVPESHDRMRNAPQAFERMRANLDGVRKTGIPFGFIFTLTQHNLHELRWVTAFAVEQGASLLQIHPLEEVGRGMTELRGQRPDELEASFAYLQTIRMQAEVGHTLAVRVDLVHRERLRDAADRLNAVTCDIGAEDRRLAEIINPLVIEPDGAVVPLQYGFSRRCQVGNLHHTSFSAMAAQWKRHGFPGFRELCATVFASELSKDTLPIFNWYEAISNASRASGGATAVSA